MHRLRRMVVYDILSVKGAKAMDKYVTGAVIRKLRKSRKMTQEELADKLFVSSKAISKWETGRFSCD